MQVSPVKFPVVTPGADLELLFKSNLPIIHDNSVLAITSKIVSLSESRVIPKKSIASKSDLIKTESEFYIDAETESSTFITIKHGVLIPSAGIDESNGNDHYILYPEYPFHSAEQIWKQVRDIFKIKNLGVIITDSHTTPLRMGVTGISIGWCGFESTRSYIGHGDIFGNKLKFTRVNNIDALAAAAVFTMGEGSEQTPISIITDIPNIIFTQTSPTSKEINDSIIDIEEDLYRPLLRGAHWNKGGSN